MTDRIAMITGADSGIGKETAAGLAAQQYTVVLACRNMEKAHAAREEIVSRTGNRNPAVLHLDLASFQSIRRCARDFLDRYDRLDILINNAGVFPSRRRLTEEGFELQFGVNHLGHFLLTCLLLERLKQSAPSRIVNVSSMMHKGGEIDFGSFRGEKAYRPIQAYRQSKLANVLFTKELARRLRGTGVVAHALHPGAVRTGIYRELPQPVRFLVTAFLLTPEQGAKTSIYVATSPREAETTGLYFEKCRPAKTSDRAQDAELAARLWEESTKLCGLDG